MNRSLAALIRRLRQLGLPLAALAGASACAPSETPSEPPGDDAQAAFGGVALKADGRYSECQLIEVLKLVNESTQDLDALRAAGLHSDAAAAVLQHRHGADGLPGTGDDDLFDSLDELDAVPFVGPVTLDRLAFRVLERCTPDLSQRPYIDSTTFGATTGGGWARDNVELEGAYAVQGITGQALRDILTRPDASGRTEYDRLRKTAAFEAFSYDFGFDSMPWDSDAHALRESFPYVVLSLESERFAVNTETHRRELTLGTDKMDDAYYDTADFRLLAHGMVLRARARWDSDSVVRRLLVGAKFDTGIDADGIKRTDKVDVRTEGGTHLETLDDGIRRGKVKWGFAEEALAPVKAVYEKLVAASALPDLAGRQDVLLLDPKARLRSIRSRFHLNEASASTVKRLHELGRERARELLAALDEATTAGRLDPTLSSLASETAPRLRAYVEGDLLREAALERLLSLDAQATIEKVDELLPGAVAPTDSDGVQRRRAVAESVDALLHELAEPFDDLERAIVGATDTRLARLDSYVKPFALWQTSLRPELGQHRTTFIFLDAYRALAPSDGLTGFNAFVEVQRTANAEGFRNLTPLTPDDFLGLGKALELEGLKIKRRQLEAAGTMARALWFDQARQFYVPDSRRASGNFIIDTFDMTEMVSEEEWQSIPEVDRTIATPLPAAKVFHTVLVNELQIELGMEEAYVKRLAELDARVASDTGTPETQAMRAGAGFVFAEYRAVLRDLAQVKGERVLSRLRRAGAPADIRWEPITDSKGNTALRILADRD
jgi:hypothetical protein